MSISEIVRRTISGLFDAIRALEKENELLRRALQKNQITEEEMDREIQKRLTIINNSWTLIKKYSQWLDR